MTAVTETPLMQQYRDIKARHPQTILFFRMGDFYEMFEDDAKLAARELGLTLTSRNNGGAAEIPLAGVPVKAATEYLRRLIAKGHRVAICEQVEDPKLAKGIVRRAVVETVTPGTVLTDDWLVRNRNNYLVAVDPRGTLMICDIGNHRIRQVDFTSGVIETFGGTGERQATPDGTPVKAAPLNGPSAPVIPPSRLRTPLSAGPPPCSVSIDLR